MVCYNVRCKDRQVIEMKKTVKKRKTSRHKIRIFVSLIVFGAITVSLGYNLFNNIVSINKMKEEKVLLNKRINDLEKEKEVLETDILKLNDPDYIGKYVREKYFYSKEGELILRIDD